MPSFKQKYSMGTEDGKYQIYWDIFAILENHEQKPVERLSVAELSKSNNFSGDPQYAMTTDVERPCIVAVLNGSTKKLIDGNHRLYKARQLNCETIPCYILPEEYHKKFILNFDSYVYEKVVSGFTESARYIPSATASPREKA